MGPNVDHLALQVSGVDLDELADSGIFEVEMGPADLYGAKGMGRGIYTRDPDGNLLGAAHLLSAGCAMIAAMDTSTILPHRGLAAPSGRPSSYPFRGLDRGPHRHRRRRSPSWPGTGFAAGVISPAAGGAARAPTVRRRRCSTTRVAKSHGRRDLILGGDAGHAICDLAERCPLA